MTTGKKQFIDSFVAGTTSYNFFSLPALEQLGFGTISRLPVSIRIVLESLLRNYDEVRVKESDISALANWAPKGNRESEIPFVVGRVLLQDFTGVPLGVDLAAMRDAAKLMQADPKIVEPLVPVDLVIDHSVQVDYSSSTDALKKNLELEFSRNMERYKFLKWCKTAFNSFKVVPPGVGICHQVNLEYLAPGVLEKDGVLYPDTLVGTDSHTTMINGLGVVGWGVGGIEAEAAMLGQPVYILTPDVVGVELTGTLPEGATATDLVLRITQMLRQAKVVGKFVEFFGQGASSLTVPDRATISNMSPEYGATMGFFPVDEKTCEYLHATGRSPQAVERFRKYFQAQRLFGIPQAGQCDYSTLLKLDLGEVTPAIAGPKRPQDRIDLPAVKETFHKLLSASKEEGGFGVSNEQKASTFTSNDGSATIKHGSVLIAAITSCTNTSNPSVMLAAGLLAKKAVEAGLSIEPTVKRSLAPGSRVVSDYLEKTGLQKYLDELGFNVVGYGCTTCIGNSGPLKSEIEETVVKHGVVAASVLSGNRNFEARVHQNIRANFLMSPPLVVAFALAGRVDIDFATEPLGASKEGKGVFLKDLWPAASEVSQLLQSAFDEESYRKRYGSCDIGNENWNAIPEQGGVTYGWDDDSTYIQNPPYFEGFSMTPPPITEIKDARPLAILGSSVTTDHISPAGAIKKDSPAGRYLNDHKVDYRDFNSFGSRRGNHEVMIRGTFANVRIRNKMVPGSEGGITLFQPSGEQMSIYDAAVKYKEQNTPLVVIAGKEYGTGSSRDWAAKGTALLGVKAVIAESYERIHRSNLIGMGVLPCEFLAGTSDESLKLDGTETFTFKGIEAGLTPRQKVPLIVNYSDGRSKEIEVLVRLDTSIEVSYYNHGGILQYVLRELIKEAS
jgi:aconitate hydratase